MTERQLMAGVLSLLVGSSWALGASCSLGAFSPIILSRLEGAHIQGICTSLGYAFFTRYSRVRVTIRTSRNLSVSYYLLI